MNNPECTNGACENPAAVKVNVVDGELLVDLHSDPPDIVRVHSEHAELAPIITGDQEAPEDAQPPHIGPGVAEAVPEHQAVVTPLPHGDDAVAGAGRNVVTVQREAHHHPGALAVEDSDQAAGGDTVHVGEAVQEPAHDNVIVSGQRENLNKKSISDSLYISQQDSLEILLQSVEQGLFLLLAAHGNIVILTF